MIESFAPIYDINTQTIIIGTMPSVASLAKQQYYAYPHNCFWKIISITFNAGKNFKTYPEKISILQKNHLGLWDALQACTREGSLDSNIKNGKPNNFPFLVTQCPQLKRLLFNGQKAYAFFMKYHRDWLCQTGLEFAILPSTSPAHARATFDEKLLTWQATLKS